MRRVVSLLVGLCAAWCVSHSVAQATTMPPPIVFTAPTPSAPTPLSVAGENLTVTCENEPEPRCDVVAQYTYQNSGAETVDLSLSIDNGWDRIVRVDGRPSRVVDGSIPTFQIAPRTESRVELRGEFTLFVSRRDFPLLIPALVTRHAVFGENPAEPHKPTYWFARSVRDSFLGGIGSAELSTRAPQGWRVASALAMERSYAQTLEGTFDSREDIGIVFSRDHGSVHNGGPFLGIGGTFGRGFHGRLGYEVGLHPLLLSSLSLETDFEEEFVITPLFEAALPVIVLLPSLGLGLGVPIRLTPEVRPGIRVQLTASFFASFVASFDYFPGANESTRVTLLGQVGL